MEAVQGTFRESDTVTGVYDVVEQLSLDVARRRQCLERAQVSNKVNVNRTRRAPVWLCRGASTEKDPSMTYIVRAAHSVATIEACPEEFQRS